MGEKKKIQINLGGMLGTIDIDEWGAVKLCNELLSNIAKSDIIDELKLYPYSAGGNERDNLRNLIIKILEEKFGCKCMAPKEVSGESALPRESSGEIAKGCPRFFRRKK